MSDQEASRPKVALVTGGGTGIGLAISQELARRGHRVMIASRNADHLATGVAAIAPHGEADSHEVDVRDPDRVAALVAATVERFGGLDVLVNNAAGNFFVPSLDMSPNAWRSVVDIVLNGTFFCSQAAARHMKDNGGGVMVNILATYAWMAEPGVAHSAAAKAGVLALTRTLAVEWARYGIRVNGVAPGPIRTAGTEEKFWKNEAMAEMMKRSIPMRRFGMPEEVAKAVAYLCSSDAAYVTGETIAVDGGQWLGNGVYRMAEIAAAAMSRG